MSNVLTVYYSKKGQTIGPGMKMVYQEKGNTRMAAEYIQEATDCDLFEIQPDRIYSEDHMELIEQAKQELQAGIRVPVKEFPDISAYDTVFVGYPNWWNTMPMVLFTFLEHYDWHGKRIIPFCTNEGSGLGESVKDIKAICHGAHICSEKAWTDSQVSSNHAKIMSWAKESI